MEKPIAKRRPHPKHFVGNPGGFIEAIRAHVDLPYRKFAAAIKRQARGKHRQASENYLYRLCHNETELKPQVVDGIAKALGLTAQEHEFLKRSAAASNGNDRSPEADSRQLLRTLAGASDSELDVKSLKALIDPLALAIYTLAGRGDLSATELTHVASRGATNAKPKRAAARDVLNMLLTLGMLTETNGKITQAVAGADLSVQMGNRVGDSAKSKAMKLFYAALDAWGAHALRDVPRESRQFRSLVFLARADRMAAMNAELAASWRQLSQAIRKKYEDERGTVVVHTGLRSWPLVDITDRV